MNPELIFFTGVYGLAFLAALVVLLGACICDFRTMTIPNSLPLAVAVAFVIAYGASLGMDHAGGAGVFAPVKVHALAFIALFAVTFLMFVLRIWGAGDSKLATSIGLWVGFKGIIPFLLVMSVVGVVLVLASWIIRRTTFSVAAFGPESWPVRSRDGQGVIPYGIAIAAGAVAAFFELGYFNITG
ncbi:MAG: A24 family peptidase [Micavibrio sp.]